MKLAYSRNFIAILAGILFLICIFLFPDDYEDMSKKQLLSSIARLEKVRDVSFSPYSYI